jgi:hypothetical protein
MLADSEMFPRTASVKAYIHWAGKDGLPVLYQFLRTSNCFISKNIIIEALPKLDGVKAAEVIASKLPELLARGAVVKAMQEIGPEGEPFVQDYLRHPDAGVRKETCKILKVIGTNKSLPGLRALLTDGNRDVAQEAQEAVSLITVRGK